MCVLMVNSIRVAVCACVCSVCVLCCVYVRTYAHVCTYVHVYVVYVNVSVLFSIPV